METGYEKDKNESVIKLIFRGVIPLALLISGVVILTSPLLGWSLLLGLPMLITGVAMVIFTYDEIISKKVYSYAEELTRCVICDKLTPRLAGINPEDSICSHCKQEILKRVVKVKKNRLI